MSRRFQPKNKDLIKLDVLSSSEVWQTQKNSKTNKTEYKLRKDLDIYGKVEKGISSAVVKTNLKGLNNQFVQDFNALPKKTKNLIVNKFLNEKKKTVYLVKSKK